MSKITLRGKTWYCPICEYSQNEDPYAPTIQHHPDWYPSVPLGKCPMGWLAPEHTPQSHKQDMGVEVRQDRMSAHVALTDELLEARQVHELDAHGNFIMEESGEVRYQFDPMTGQITPFPVMVPKMRCLTTQELAELKQQRDQNLDQLESIAVKEV